MTRYDLLLLLLLLLPYPSHQCETGVAHVNSVLSVPRSLMANADVAFLKAYNATTLTRCMEDCCSGKYGSCSVASFNKNTTKENCMHFYCRPLNKCKFLSSTSTDSFSFSSNPPLAVPSDHKSAATSTTTTVEPKAATKEEIANFSEEQFALKNDNTTIKPRKGVEDLRPPEESSKSGVKPRKGVSMDDVPHSKLIPNSINKSNVKARKGVGPYFNSTTLAVPHLSSKTMPGEQYISPSADIGVASTATSMEDIGTNELISALQKAFEDDAHTTGTKLSAAAASEFSTSVIISPTPSASDAYSTNSVEQFDSRSHTRLFPSYNTESSSLGSSSTRTLILQTSVRHFVSEAVEEQIVTYSSSSSTPVLPVSSTQKPKEVSSRGPVKEGFHKKLVATAIDEDVETESDRKYKSSIHLVLSLVFGLLVLFAVLGVVAKRVYDGWLRRDYYRMNYLIDGIYNGED